MNLNLKDVLIALPIIMLAACSNKNPEKGLELNCSFNNAHGETLYLEHMSTNGVLVIDTLKLNDNGSFNLKTDKVKEIGFYRLKTTNNNFTTFIFNPGEKVVLKADINNLVGSYNVSGSPESELLMEINKVSIKNFYQRDSLQKGYQEYMKAGLGTPEQIGIAGKNAEEQYAKLVEAYDAYMINFVSTHSSSFASLAAIQQLPIDNYFQTYVKLDESLSLKFPNSEYVKSFHANIATKAAVTIGGKAPEIKMNTPEGTPLALSSLKGKVVLIDFWASWCGPCRMENPNVVQAYNKYKAKGFDIYSVSLDADLGKWKAAIAKDNLTWKNHVSDFKAWQTPVVQLYGFSGIPYNVLIDKNGVIIAKNLRGAELEKTLNEVFK